jgi:DNA-binding NarL/FixJ family response regulator
MRVAVVGTRDERMRLRRNADAACLEVVGEFETVAAARNAVPDVDALLVAVRRPEITAVEEPLTPREREVLAFLADGLANKSIAVALRISDQTVKAHVAAICGKLGAVNRTDAVRKAIRRGLVAM